MLKGNRLMGSLAALLVMGPARAEDASQPMFKFRGFMTLAATSSSEKNADFVSNTVQPNGPGYTRSVDFGVDSRAGAQVDARFTDWFSGVVQVVSEHRYDNHYVPYVNMANLKFQATPGLALRVGRMPFSAYLISDYQKVGYSMPWVRPPVEVYQFNPLNYVDGADAVFQHNLGSVAIAWQVSAGTSSAKLPSEQSSEFKGKDVYSMSVNATYGSSTFRAFYLQMKGTVDSTALDAPGGYYDILRTPKVPFPPFGLVPNPYYDPAAADQYQIKGDKVTYFSAGYAYDPGSWFLQFEASRNAGDENQLLHATSGYVTGGVRFGAWTPYATVAEKKTDSPITHPNPIINGIIATANKAQSSTALGLRWDFMANADLKLQVDWVKNAAHADGALINLQPAFKPGESYNLVTLCLDFVF
jgi:hypothetical protein